MLNAREMYRRSACEIKHFFANGFARR